jgi:hypothetical protein
VSAGGRAGDGLRVLGGETWRAGERERGLGQIRSSRGGDFLFLFLFSPISISLIPFLSNNNSPNFLGAKNKILYVKCYKKSWCMHMMNIMLHGVLGDN